MALDLNGFKADLAAFLAALPTTEAGCAAQWATIVREYTSGIVPPVAGGAQDGTATAFEAALSGMGTPGTGIGVFETAFAGYAATLAGAMAPPGTPPPAPLSTTLAAVYSTNNNPATTASQAGDALAIAIDLWFRTGLSGPPGPVPWS